MAGGLCLALAVRLAAQGQSSLSDKSIEFSEAKLSLQSATEENESLRKQIDLSRQTIQTLTESLAIANSEAEVFKREAQNVKLRMEALGIESAAPDKSQLEQRLLKAVRDLELLQKERDKLAEQLVRLSEALVRYLKNAESSDGEARMALEAEMREASELLGVTPPHTAQAGAVPATLTDGMVISIKAEYALVVANLGRMHGVKMGMPFQVWRGDTLIGQVRVVDVREKISGAVIQSLISAKDKVKVGDRLKVDARQ
jgi:hypothetical protein